MLGYRFCLQQLGLNAWPLRMESRVGSRRETAREGELHLLQTFPSSYVPSAAGESRLFAHMEFALRYEGIDLAAMTAICSRVEPPPVAAWIASRPSSKYARKLGFLYEWTTGREIPLDATIIRGAYEPILDEATYFTGAPVNSLRWHIRNNLPGTPDWCPTIHRATLSGERIGGLDVRAALTEARGQVPAEIFERALSYAYPAETQASYAIEHDAPTPTQRHAFVRALQTAGDLPVSERLTPDSLMDLQELIFRGVPTFVFHGLRTDDIFVGTTSRLGLRRIDYPCPPARAVEALLRGLRESVGTRLAGSAVPPAVFCGIVSFGFVFIHPLSDGNGRIHRFLIHEALMERGSLDKGALIPISATMLSQIREYDAALRAYSQRIRAATENLAGVPMVLESTEPFQFTAYDDVAPLYRFPTLTDQVAHLEKTIAQSIQEDLLDESRFLLQFDQARARLAQMLNMAASRLDLLIQFVQQNGGTLSRNKRNRHFSDLTDEAVEMAEKAVRESFTSPSRRSARRS